MGTKYKLYYYVQFCLSLLSPLHHPLRHSLHHYIPVLCYYIPVLPHLHSLPSQ